MDASKKTSRRMNPEELEAVKENLLKRKEELWQEILEDLENDAREEHKNIIDIIREQGDIALEELRSSTAFSLIELKHDELQQIEQALQRIERGEYGRCVDCGRWITPARLEVMPYAVRCRRCQAEHEKLEKMQAE
ncbi:MAG: hypothetical protein DRH11_07070 [Deltaproteobacteria bacterium]|nr:TraR/DksA C4-type zinc finger protein [Deltaproteobacteria bacterium]MBW1935973.1 TraR/DksA C4-type zinc finger protein [Deltaproteobacteria bacterium]RLB34126.1 MAG: hypothetical protein DRH11_07070 [Deltaproteobacteria bacterium]